MIERIVYGIGAQRTGTTWLAKRIGKHSRVRQALGNLKEVHYFDAVHGLESPQHVDLPGVKPGTGRTARVAALQKRLERIAELAERFPKRRCELETQARLIEAFLTGPFDDALYERSFAASPGDWCLDVTPAYKALPAQGHEHMQRIGDWVELILILRNPVKRALSALRHMHGRGRMDLTAADTDTLCELGRLVVATADYSAILETLRSRFGTEHVHHFWFEDITARPNGLLTDILACLDLDLEPACLVEVDKAPNPTKPVPIDGVVIDAITDACRPIVERLDRSDGPVPARWWDSLRADVGL